MILFCCAKDCLYPLGPVVWIKDAVQTFCPMNGGDFGWTDLTVQCKHNNVNFNTISAL